MKHKTQKFYAEILTQEGCHFCGQLIQCTPSGISLACPSKTQNIPCDIPFSMIKTIKVHKNGTLADALG